MLSMEKRNNLLLALHFIFMGNREKSTKFQTIRMHLVWKKQTLQLYAAHCLQLVKTFP